MFGLQDELEEQAVDASKVEHVEFPPEPVVVKKPVVAADGEGGEQPPPEGGEEGGEAKAPAF